MAYGYALRNHIITNVDMDPVKDISTEEKEKEEEEEKTLESELHPMSETMYNMLCCVHGFTENNGSTYACYVTRWRVRYNKSLSDALT